MISMINIGNIRFNSYQCSMITMQRSFYILWGTDFCNNFHYFRKKKKTKGITLACG